MSARSSSTHLLPPVPARGASDVTATGKREMRSTQSAQQLDERGRWTEVARLHSVGTRQPLVSTASVSNVLRSLSGIHRTVSALPTTLLDLDAVSTAGLQILRPDTHPEAFVPVPPDGGWGWVVVFAAFITNLIIDGICVSFGIMVTDLVDHFNAPVATVMLMGSLMLGIYQIVGPVAAGLVNRFGCRAVGIVGSLSATVSMFVSAYVPSINLMLVSYGVFAGAAFGLLHLPSIICVSFYFDSRRALAIGVTSCGTPLGAMIFAPLSEVLLQKYGWSNTLILFAGMLLNCTAFATLYRPLTPALVLTPMKASDAKEIELLLQLAASEEAAAATVAGASGDRLGVGGTTPSIGSQSNLRNQPVLEENEEVGGVEEAIPKDATNEEEEEEEKIGQSLPRPSKAGQDKLPQPQLEAISEGEGEVGAKATEKKKKKVKECDIEMESEREGEKVNTRHEVKLRHHRHHGRRKPRKTLYNRLQHQYALWLLGIRLMRGKKTKKTKKKEEEDEAFEDAADDSDLNRARAESDALDSDSGASTCGSSCDQTTSHWDSESTSDFASVSSNTFIAQVDAAGAEVGASAVTGTEGDNGEMLPLERASGKQTTGSGSRLSVLQDKRSGVTHREASTAESIFPAHSLNQAERYRICTKGGSGIQERRWRQQRQQQRRHLRRPCHRSECQSSRAYARLIPQQSAIHLANISVPWRRSESVAANVLARSHLSSIGSAMLTSAVGGGAITSLEDLIDNAPVIVELPHESITVEDYARPLYRKDIFFSGSVKRHIESSKASVAASTTGTLRGQLGGSQVSMKMADWVRGRKTTAETVDMAEENALVDANRTGSCLMSLTKIPLPDVFTKDEEKGANAFAGAGTRLSTCTKGVVKDESLLWDRVKVEAELKRLDKPVDGIFRVPRSHSLCGWWLCWETRRLHGLNQETGEVNRVDYFSHSLANVEGHGRDDKKFPQHARLVLIRKCAFLPKSMFDVLMTMTNLSLLKEKSFTMYCLASLVSVMGIYVPLFFVCDLANSFGIPKGQSAYLLTVYGGASVLSRLAASWAAGQPKMSATMLCALTLLLTGVAVCAMPYWGSLSGQIVLMVIFGLAVSPFFALTSVILCEILGLEVLTNAYGIVTMVRGIASTVGSPVAGMIVEATRTFSEALQIAGLMVIVGGVLYVVIIFQERAKLKKVMSALDNEQGRM